MKVELKEDLRQINEAFHRSKMSQHEYRTQRRELIESLRKPTAKPPSIQKKPIAMYRIAAVAALSLALVLILFATRTNT